MKLQQFVTEEYLPYAEANLKPRTVSEYVRLFRTVVFPPLGNRHIERLTTRKVELWHLKLRKKTPTQANRALAALSSALRLAARWGRIPVNPAHGVSQARETPRERYFSPDEIRRILEAVTKLAPEERVFILLALYTGARPGELVNARWEWLKDGNLELPDSKTGRRTLFLPKQARQVLETVWPATGTLFAFGVMPARGKMFPHILNPQLPWRKVSRRAGLENARLYDLRHTFASAGLAAGLPLEAVSQLLGHKDVRTSRRYVHLMPEVGNDAAARTAAALDGML